MKFMMTVDSLNRLVDAAKNYVDKSRFRNSVYTKMVVVERESDRCVVECVLTDGIQAVQVRTVLFSYTGTSEMFSENEFYMAIPEKKYKEKTGYFCVEVDGMITTYLFENSSTALLCNADDVKMAEMGVSLQGPYFSAQADAEANSFCVDAKRLCEALEPFTKAKTTVKSVKIEVVDSSVMRIRPASEVGISMQSILCLVRPKKGCEFYGE